MKLIIGCDEAAYELKETLITYLENKGYELVDVGTYQAKPCLYPDVAQALCEKILNHEAEKGILLCGTGIGMAITANKMPGIRAAVGHDLFSIERSRKSNDCQVLCMGARIVAPQYAQMLVDHWLDCEFSGGPSREKVAEITKIEQEVLGGMYAKNHQ